MATPDAYQLVVSIITVVTAVLIGVLTLDQRMTPCDGSLVDHTRHRDRREFWYMVLAALVIAGIVLFIAYIPALDWIDWNAWTLAISAAMAFYIGSACQSLRSRIAGRESADK